MILETALVAAPHPVLMGRCVSAGGWAVTYDDRERVVEPNACGAGAEMETAGAP